ncbi:ATP-binding protein [Oceaniovalibus sp. ACAM 378]|uniref:ATP-binding protein n=1 Tax=Oceaniovalibus sp. ACAM 378 TaxID=2599923 RepID=UPI0011D398E6|nr:ATP-binding protein [Oceaniovalibus sp. ACAM 378]TYB89936.1 ATP-binding protein [Oceaniovalibus sp. ACAM 378]
MDGAASATTTARATSRTAALAHLEAHMDLLRLRMARQVALLRATGRFVEDPFRGLYVGAAQAEAILDPLDADPVAQTELARFDARIAGIEAAMTCMGDTGLPLVHLATTFGLGAGEMTALVAATAAEIDPGFATLFSYAQNDASRTRPTLGLILELGNEACTGIDLKARAALRCRFGPEAPLLRFALLEAGDDQAFGLSTPLRLAPGMLPWILGDSAEAAAMDPDFATALHLLKPLPRLWPVLEDEAKRLFAALVDGAPTLVSLIVPRPDCGAEGLAAAVAHRLGWPLLAFDPHHPGVCAPVAASRLGRALRLSDAALFLSGDAPVSDAPRIAAGLRPGCPVFLCGTEPVDQRLLPPGARLLECRLPAAGIRERQAVWSALLPASAPDGMAHRLAASTRLGPLGAARELQRHGRSLDIRPTPSPALLRFGQSVKAEGTLDDLVLPEESRADLEILLRALTHGSRVHDDWGFRSSGPRATLALFNGASGTGKTFAAGLVAATAGLSLYRVDLSALVSKYIGETEKQLETLLTAAEEVGAALLFDEGDALFGKRSEVKDARDRYANQEVAFLLQRIEAFDGLIVLTTNLSAHIDSAFLRRIAVAVHFPMPDAALRRRLWARALPEAAPRDDAIDWRALAERFELSGGGIRNAALGAAYAAAGDDRPIAMADLVQSVARELRKGGRMPSRTDVKTNGATPAFRRPSA